MKTKLSICFSVLFLLTMMRVEAAIPEFKISETKSEFYQKENLNLVLSLQTPHAPMKAEYYIVNSKTKSKSFLGKFDLESMSAGFGAGLIIDQKPGTYYYLLVLTENKIKTEYKSSEIKIMDRSKVSKVKIEDFKVVFEPIPYYEQQTDQEYKIAFISKTKQQFSDILSTIKVKCSSDITFYEKGGETKCSKKKSIALNMSGSNFDYGFRIDEEDLQKDVKLQIEYKLINNLNKTLDIVKKKMVLSAN